MLAIGIRAQCDVSRHARPMWQDINVVFSCGLVPLDDQGDRIRVYYGAADSVIAAADFSVAAILDSLIPPDSPAGHQRKFLV